MSETADRAALLLEATEYPGWSSWCDDIIDRLAAALADAERDLAKAWRDGCDAGFEYGYVKGSTDPDFVDATDAPTNPHTPDA